MVNLLENPEVLGKNAIYDYKIGVHEIFIL